ncbi:MAG: phosphonate ABC transporter, permease protein PhnE [Acidimicrobiia bacterium]|nr:phosphonate ABC transporter, permease protein PhnE [Acidimicrobiia bacterium]
MNAPDPAGRPSPADRRQRLEELLDSARTPAERLRQTVTVGGGVLVALVVLYVSARDTDLSLGEFVRGLPAIASYVGRMFPPDWAFTPRIVQPTIETIEIAIWGTVLGIVLAIPLGLMAARNISPHVVVYGSARFILNALRGVSELVFALIFVSAVGLGPFPGILALALHNAGMLGKFYAEAIEAVDRGPVEAMQSTGAGWSQTVAYAIVPQILPHFITYNLYRFEVSIRSATVLGLVGAGGIGFHLISSIRLFDYQTTAMVLIVIIALVILTDWAGNKIRARIL